MPAVYAHYKMGQEIREKLNGAERDIIEKYPELYMIGLHGPDILFYHKVIKPNKVNGLGFAMHKKAGTEFFEKAADIIKNAKNKAAAKAYVYGFICHFAMDVTCHGFVNQWVAESGVSHTEIESEFDRELLVTDKKNPLKEKLTRHIVPSKKNASVIKKFFENSGVEEIDEQSIRKTLKDMIFYSDMLTTSSKIKRAVIYAVLRFIGKYDAMHGLIINYEKNPKCIDSTKRLIELYEESGELAVKLITEYKDFVSGKAPLNDIYNYNFNSELPKIKQ